MTIDMQLDDGIYSLDAINSAAYRIIAEASCTIEKQSGFYLCCLSPKDHKVNEEVIRQRFLDVLTDETLRERLEKQTQPMRNLIVALAFGALASQSDK